MPGRGTARPAETSHFHQKARILAKQSPGWRSLDVMTVHLIGAQAGRRRRLVAMQRLQQPGYSGGKGSGVASKVVHPAWARLTTKSRWPSALRCARQAVRG